MEPNELPSESNEKKKSRKLSFKSLRNTFGNNSKNMCLNEDDVSCTCSSAQKNNNHTGTSSNTSTNNHSKLLNGIKSVKRAICRFCKSKQRINTPPETLTTDGWTNDYSYTRDNNSQTSPPSRIPTLPTTEKASKKSLTEELSNLAHYGWYWGPMTASEVEKRLSNMPDGSFMVRDSSSDKYLLTVSFRSAGKTLHTRIEHNFGYFNFSCQDPCFHFRSILDLIEYSMYLSKKDVFCYSKARSPTDPSFPVRLIRPVSRFTKVPSLQYLCRFVIRQYTQVDNIIKLPLPKPVQEYVLEGYF